MAKRGLRLKRAYQPAAPADGVRVLVDRLWPRGLARDKAAVDLWAKDLAPSRELRTWFGHDPERWSEFRRRYHEELEPKRELVEDLRKLAAKGAVTLLFAAKDLQHNNAVVLKDLIEAKGR